MCCYFQASKRKRTEEAPTSLEEGECSNSSCECVEETTSQHDDNEELSGSVYNRLFCVHVTFSLILI